MEDNNKFKLQQKELNDGKLLVKKMQRSRQVRKGRKRQNAFRTLLCLIMNVIIVFALYYLTTMPQWYLNPNAFTSGESIEIVNNKIVSTPKILSALKSEEILNLPIYMMNTKGLKEKLMQLSPIDEVYIRRYAFPARLQIILRERQPYIMISPDVKVPPVAFFTKDGTLIGREYLPLKSEYKTLLILSYGNKGDDYAKWDLKKLQRIESLAKHVEIYSKEPVEYIDLRDPEDIYIKIKTVNMRLGKLDSGIFDRVKKIPSVLPQVQLLDSDLEYIDLRWDNPFFKLGK